MFAIKSQLCVQKNAVELDLRPIVVAQFTQIDLLHLALAHAQISVINEAACQVSDIVAR